MESPNSNNNENLPNREGFLFRDATNMDRAYL